VPEARALIVVQHVPHLPAREVLRFGLRIVWRLVLATLGGLVVLKIGQALFGWSAADAIRYAEIATAIGFAASFLVCAIPYPEIDYGPELETPIQD
jgi:hypothetical protein